jgi:fatty acid desaturase
MRLEHLPLVLGLLFVVAGVALIADALLREQPLMRSDRRKRSRAPRHPGGQVAIGAGALFVAAALFGRDGWRYGTVAVLIGVIAFATGVWLNWGYVKAFMLGPESRAHDVEDQDRPMQRRSRVPLDREVPTPAVAGDLVAGVTPEIEPEPPRTSVPPGETRRLRIR